MKPSILVLDDDENRINWLNKSFPYIRVVWAYDVETFFKLYEKEVNSGYLISIILDHDLGLESESGMDVAKKLITKIITIVWSVNTVAGPQMYQRLKDNKVPTLYIPFIQQQILTKAIDEFYKKFTQILGKINNNQLN